MGEWPSLPLDDWFDTHTTVHLWTQMYQEVGRNPESRAAAAWALAALKAAAAVIDDPALRRSLEASEPMVRPRSAAAIP